MSRWTLNICIACDRPKMMPLKAKRCRPCAKARQREQVRRSNERQAA